MGIFDKAKDMAGQHPDQVNQGIDKAGDMLDDKTGGKFSEHTDKAQDVAKGRLGKPTDAAQAENAPAPADQPVDGQPTPAVEQPETQGE